MATPTSGTNETGNHILCDHVLYMHLHCVYPHKSTVHAPTLCISAQEYYTCTYTVYICTRVLYMTLHCVYLHKRSTHMKRIEVFVFVNVRRSYSVKRREEVIC